MKIKNYSTAITKILSITIILLGLSACGYKAPPYYLEDAPAGDENVEFTLKKVNENSDETMNPKCDK